jgi:hypothetical protein
MAGLPGCMVNLTRAGSMPARNRSESHRKSGDRDARRTMVPPGLPGSDANLTRARAGSTPARHRSESHRKAQGRQDNGTSGGLHGQLDPGRLDAGPALIRVPYPGNRCSQGLT